MKTKYALLMQKSIEFELNLVVYKKSTSAALRMIDWAREHYDEPCWTVDLVVSVEKLMCLMSQIL